MAAIVFAVTLLCSYLVGIVAVQRTAQVDAERAVEQHLEEASSSLDDAETAQRGYLLTTNERYLQIYKRATAQIEAGKSILQTDAASGALSSTAVESLIQRITGKEDEMTRTLQLEQTNGLPTAAAAMRTGVGEQLTDAFRQELERMKMNVLAGLALSMRRARAADLAGTATFALTIIVNLLFLAWADHHVSRTAGEREEAVMEATQQKDLLTTTLASISDGVIVTDVHERITFLNAEAARLTGWKPPEAVGQPISSVFQIVHASSRLAMESPVRKALRTGIPTGEDNHTVLLSKTGAEYPIDDSAAPIQAEQGTLSGVVLVFRDWTNQRRAEEARARLAAIVESSEDAILSKNLDGIIQTWNIGAERLLGYTPGEIIGKPIMELVPPERQVEEDFILGQVRQGQKVERIETIRVAKDGRRIPVALGASPIKDENGRISGASSMMHDVTEIVAAREELSLSREELERQVEERTLKLQDVVNELQHVSYSITHDMRAPLRAMSAFADILMDQTSPSRPTPAEAQDYCRRIVRAARRLDQLIVDALSYTKVVLQEIPQGPVHLDNIVGDLIDVYPHLHPDRADIKVEGTLPVVLGNESYLTQCFSNLLGNAVKFVAPGVNPRIRLHAETRGKMARIWVEDNGIGIPLAAQRRLFGMYEKLDDRYEGTGIGLAVVRKVVERMGGTVGAESEPGRGSRFWVELRPADKDRVTTP